MNLGPDAGELEALTYERRRDAEPGGDVLGSPSFIGKRLESLELVGRMPGHAHFVFGEADFFSVDLIDDVAGDLRVLVERLLLDEQFESSVTARAGQHLVFAFVGLADLEILQRADGPDIRGQRFDAFIDAGFADIVCRRHESRERDHLDLHVEFLSVAFRVPAKTLDPRARRP
jgi:hypothetical protein